MNELSLFTGAGGGVLGTHLLGWRPIGYVEWDDYCQRVIAARVRDGFLPAAPIFGDVREFAQSGAADEYRGFADVVSAGFPCQPFSVAGKQRAADDERNMWPATAEVIRRVQPRSVLLENVPGLISCGYVGTVIGDLAALGYVGRWGVLGACDAGAPHRRDRLWIVASNASRSDGERCGQKPCVFEGPRTIAPGICTHVAHADSAQREGMRGPFGVQPEHADVGSGGWWESEPDVGRVANGVPNRVDRLKALGNAQVASVVRMAWEALA